MKRIWAPVAILFTVFMLVPLPGSAQSENDGIAIYQESQNLLKNSSSKEDLERALEQYIKALEIFRKIQSEKWVARTLNDIGWVYQRRNQPREAMEHFGKALEIHKKIGDIKAEGAALDGMGRVYNTLNQYEKAMEYSQKALEIFKRAGDTNREAPILANMAVVSEKMGEYRKALEYSEKALEIHRSAGNAVAEGQALTHMCLVYDRLGQYEKALECGGTALEIFTKISNLPGRATALNNMGLVHRDLGQSQKALEYYEEALDIRRKTGAEDKAAMLRNNLGLVYSDLGQYQRALQAYEQAIEICKKEGDVRGEGVALTNAGRVHSCLGQYQKALEYYKKSLEIHSKIGNAQFEASSWSALGSLYLSWGQFQKALENLARALNSYRRIGSQSGESNTLSSIGGVYFVSAQYEEALKNYKEALEINERIGIPSTRVKSLIAWTYMEKGDLAEAENALKGVESNWAVAKLHLLKLEYDDAENAYEKILESARKTGNVHTLFAAYTGLGKLYEGREDYKKAEECYRKGMEVIEEIRSSLLPAERKNFLNVKEAGFDRSEPAKGLTRVRMILNQADESIDSSEATRARSFADNIALRSESGYSSVPAPVLQEEDELVNKVASLKKELARTEKNASPLRHENLSNAVKEAEAGLKAFIGTLWSNHKAYAAVKYPRPVTLKESALRPEECVIIFDVSEEGVGVKLIRGREIAQSYYNRWKFTDLERDVLTFRACFEKASLRDFNPELGSTLYKKLLSRVTMELPEGTPLMIIPDGVLAVLPFEALVVRGKPTWGSSEYGEYPAGLTYLGDIHPISYYQSITSLSLARTLGAKQKPGEQMLVVADPVFDPTDQRAREAGQDGITRNDEKLVVNIMSASEEAGEERIKFSRLKATGALAKNLKKEFGSSCDTITDLKASKEYFMKAVAPKLGQYGSVVFATHGLFSNKVPSLLEPFLALTMVPPGTDGFLKMSDVMGLKMNADVVALTACQTGLGRELSGEGIMSMGRAFQYAGAKSVLMSLWSVADTPSINLTENFFKNRKAGKSKLESLQLARGEIRKQGFEHPFFWAAFILVGEKD
jgi:tetratricopeptide (TPR) repeat protein